MLLKITKGQMVLQECNLEMYMLVKLFSNIRKKTKNIPIDFMKLEKLW